MDPQNQNSVLQYMEHQLVLEPGGMSLPLGTSEEGEN